MTSAMTATSEHNGQTLTRAVDGEKAGMESGPAPLGAILEELVKRAELAKDGVWGHINWSQELSMATGGTNTVFSLTVGAISCVVLYNNTRYKAFASSGLTATLANTEGPLANLANSTWYYVYLYDNAGTLAVQISATVPNANRVFKTGDTRYRYIGCFRTNAAGAPLPFLARRGRYRYLFSAIGNTDITRVLNVGGSSATSWAAVSCAAVVPPHARLARAWVSLDVNTATNVVQFRTTGTSTFAKTFLGTTTDAFYFEVGLELDTSQQFDYQVTNAADALTVYVTEFEE